MSERLFPNESEFHRVVASDMDELSVVIKCHFAVDQLLNTALRHHLTSSRSVETGRMAFVLKADLLIGLGMMNDSVRQCFERANALRNVFAHNPYAKLGIKESQQVHSTVAMVVPALDLTGVSTSDEPLEAVKLLYGLCYYWLYNGIRLRVIQKAVSTSMGKLVQNVLAKVSNEGLTPKERTVRYATDLLRSQYSDIGDVEKDLESLI